MIAAGLAATYLALLLLKAWLAVRAARRAPREGDQEFSRVCVAQAILSGDPRLCDTLEDNLRTLPSAQFVWLVDADDAAAHVICYALQARHADTRIQVLVLPPPLDGVNPKLLKLERVRGVVGDRVLLVLDDDTRMPAASLSAILDGLTRYELVTALPAYLDAGRWPSRLLAQFVNNNSALTYLPLLNVMPPLTINGMAYAIRGATLDALGGFGPVMHAVTDDLAVARQVIAGGGRLCQTAAPVWVQTTVGDVWHYLRQMHRWFVFALLLLRLQPMAVRAVIVLLHGTPPLLLWSAGAAAALWPSWTGLILLMVLLVVRAGVLVALQRRIYGRPLHRPVWSIASEVLQPLHIVHALLQRTIVWRNRRYVVRGDLTLEALP